VEKQPSPARPKRQVITPASVREASGESEGALKGYAIHTGEARSMADVTVRDGTAPILERGEGDDDEIEEVLADALPSSGNAPD
jgi:hypothetical protein